MEYRLGGSRITFKVPRFGAPTAVFPEASGVQDCDACTNVATLLYILEVVYPLNIGIVIRE